jgi:hypothetical protein
VLEKFFKSIALISGVFMVLVIGNCYRRATILLRASCLLLFVLCGYASRQRGDR